MSTEEEKIKAEADKLEVELTGASVSVGTWVKVHYVYLAGIGGALLGYILGKVHL